MFPPVKTQRTTGHDKYNRNMRVNYGNIPRFLGALFIAAILCMLMSEEYGLRYTISVPLSLFVVNQLQSRGLL